MPARHSRFDYVGRVKRRHKAMLAAGIGVFALLVTAFVILSGKRSALTNESRELARLWQDGEYMAAFSLSEKELEAKPMDFFVLMVHGFSAYQIAAAQIDTFSTLSYIDRSIWALRKAMLTKQGERDLRVKYALGRAYHYKGPVYAELCVRYLKEARQAGYEAEDISQFLGLAYASVHDYRSSVEAFDEALAQEQAAGRQPSDQLLLAIARSYVELGDRENATMYIMKAIEVSKDWNAIAQARLLLAGIMMDAGDTQEAEAQIRLVLSEGGESAEARYRLGVLYNIRNDYYRARAEWRRAYNLDPNYAPVREKLNL